ncbi:DUF535 family protein [Dyella sp. BiH032]|uniref:VirK/YbjX family protein n=1 Tax=Dyella sp. BiH032 TaxID=3075430 RepID=UPI002892C4CD|nr:DUF535 family protein [Dyella sp. BiH032]WNL44801.1 DUF535 family protein [Dyella sp. BiH032]
MNTSSPSPAGMTLDVALGLKRRDAGLPRPNVARPGGWIASLRHRQDWPASQPARFIEAAKYLVRALCLPRRHARYLRFVQGHAPMRAFRRRDPRLLERHLHRFVNARWKRRDRLRALLAHYQFATSALPTPLFDAVYVEGGVPLGLLVLKDGRELILSLRPPLDKGCEGELGIQLEGMDGRTLYRIVFTVIDDGRTLAIGCLQGPGGPDAREAVRELTRQMHGLRPKQLMLALACAFARHFGIAQVLGIANAAHPLSRRRAGIFQADYDAFWLEQQGVAEADTGWFVLPADPPRKAEADVPSHHRSAFRRREGLRAAAEAVLVRALCRSAPRADNATEMAAHFASTYASQEHAWIP